MRPLRGSQVRAQVRTWRPLLTNRRFVRNEGVTNLVPFGERFVTPSTHLRCARTCTYWRSNLNPFSQISSFRRNLVPFFHLRLHVRATERERRGRTYLASPKGTQTRTCTCLRPLRGSQVLSVTNKSGYKYVPCINCTQLRCHVLQIGRARTYNRKS